MEKLSTTLAALVISATACSEAPSAGFQYAQADAAISLDGNNDSEQDAEDPCEQVSDPELLKILSKSTSIIERVTATIKLHPEQVHPPSKQRTGYKGKEVITPDGLFRFTESGYVLGAAIIREQPAKTEYVWVANTSPSVNQMDGAICASAHTGEVICSDNCNDHTSGDLTGVSIPCQSTPTVEIETLRYDKDDATPSQPKQSIKKAPAKEAELLIQCLRTTIQKGLDAKL